MNELNNRVREFRARDRLSQSELAQKIGASRQTIALIERGDYSPSVVLALKIAEVFAVTVESVFWINHGEDKQDE
ncbi:helix-turn-helix transcriptional regulator [Paenibacillus sp. MMS20-IR301]|uniref:helix-turn-helix transcriptional regulator n=1 Tax=Paenibacillus sp. MMS20-IR301 TaxID=2895946 RepID=UPI0028EB22E8|nr:helix-turn-helix transcriptional regulator [Paenibacillus sp. MMS20-IR301]WNS45539.1 helix-turn-helix transcriptional regulator [Paenibacillus sp. MMS20-IR301]